MAFHTTGLKGSRAVSNKVLIRLRVLAGPDPWHKSCTALLRMRLAKKYSFAKVTKKASVLFAPASLKSRCAFCVAKVPVHQQLSVAYLKDRWA